MPGNSRKKLVTTLPSDARNEKGSEGTLRAGKAGRKTSTQTMSPALAPPTDEGSASVTKAKTPSNDAAQQSDKSTKKPKVVRDSFTMPAHDYGKLAELKRKCLAGGVPVKKSELLGAGLWALEALSQERLLSVVAQVEAVKTGHPAKS
ncbi:hypothetical protein KB879_31540 (plasmid) [Cupriavidus sp. KK10]|uniref:hypothetical protein n=1 Tax=Cupriavidus sp. KK10 TaxID=1478019 RepID=UPI001BABDACF|nr:hypothetical protein [Cupriavidus sp. KK10]QUN32272.1 hypothetical protein KB879_31540 [Cupriavidus sp. KK10]